MDLSLPFITFDTKSTYEFAAIGPRKTVNPNKTPVRMCRDKRELQQSGNFYSNETETERRA